jgi:DNA-directed RNA polymerase specialized sigma24 family protein
MTPDQFTALAELLRLRDGPAREVARMVLVEGRKTPEAAESVGMQYRAAAAAVQRARSGLELVQKVCG